MATRCFINALPDFTGPGPAAVDRPALLHLLRSTLDRVLADPGTSANPSVYTGLSGVAYALWHVGRVPEGRQMLLERVDTGAAARFSWQALHTLRRSSL